MTILSLFEIRKIPEAEFYLNRLSSLPEETVGHYIFWPVEACKAYIMCMNGDYAGAFESHEKSGRTFTVCRLEASEWSMEL